MNRRSKYSSKKRKMENKTKNKRMCSYS